MTKKKEKKLSPEEKRDLKFLVEDFLEKTPDEIANAIENPDDAEIFWNRFESILFKDIFWQDELDPEDKVGTDFGKLILEYHDYLKPVWDQFRDSIFEYKYEVIPARERESASRKQPVTHEFKDLYQESIINWEQFYNITVTVSFDPGHVTFYKRSLNILLNFMDLLKDIPIYYFARCEHCEKCIVLTRSDKKHCKGCAAKKKQKEKWASDPEGMRLSEIERYRTKRKK